MAQYEVIDNRLLKVEQRSGFCILSIASISGIDVYKSGGISRLQFFLEGTLSGSAVLTYAEKDKTEYEYDLNFFMGLLK